MADPTPRHRTSRRDFLTGTVAGVAVTRGVEYVWPDVAYRPAGFKDAFAQCGEDLIVEMLLRVLKMDIPSITYLDIGAYKPVLSNNTYLFYRGGAHGVLVEPNVDLISELKQRKRDTVLNIGIGFTDDKEADYYRMSAPQLNTFSKDEAEGYVKNTPGVTIKEVVKIPLVNINEIIAKHMGDKAPDYLSVDTEGLDYEILKGLDFKKYRPSIICAETVDLGPVQNHPMVTKLLLENGYLPRSVTYPNTIFVEKSKIV